MFLNDSVLRALIIINNINYIFWLAIYITASAVLQMYSCAVRVLFNNG